MPRLARIQLHDPRRPPLTPAQQRVVSMSQWMTEPWLAAIVAEIAEVRGKNVLEPSAGTGNIAAAALAAGAADVTMVEMDARLAARLALRFAEYTPKRVEIAARDFLDADLDLRRGMTFDVAPMNPKYEDGADLAHVLRALKLARRVVAILRLNAIVGKERYEALWSRFDVRQIFALPSRPDFGEEARRVGLDSNGAESDFCVVDVLARPRRPGSRPSFDWIRRPA